jgi:hypothetical protein
VAEAGFEAGGFSIEEYLSHGGSFCATDEGRALS